MARGEGRVFLRGQRWWIAYYHRGREVRESSGTDNQRLAERLLGERLRQIGVGAFVGPHQNRITLAELLEVFRVELVSREPKGWRSLKGLFPRLTAALGHHRAIDVMPEHLHRYYQDLREGGAAKATAANYLWCLKAAFKLGVRHRRIAQVPDFPRLGKLRNARQGFVEPEQFEKIARRLPKIGQEIARFAYHSAWREGEVLTLRWEIVDRRAGEVRLADSKNDEPRSLPLEGELARIIDRRWAARVVGRRIVPRVFHHRGGRAVAETTLRGWWRDAAIGAGYPGLVFHDLRRSGIRNMIRAGVSEPVAMSISGHRSVGIFRRYNITTTADQRRALVQTQEYVDSQRVTTLPRSKGRR